MTSGPGPRRALEAERQSALHRLAGLQREFDAMTGAAAAAANADDEHDPEGATIAFERQHLAALLDQARGRLKAIDAALRQVADGGYGICEGCGEPIPAARMAARPTATTCTACASRSGRGPDRGGRGPRPRSG